MRVISLSSIPPRFATLGPTLRSLTQQRGGIDEVRLHIPRHYRRFPEYSGELPEVPEGIRIVRTEEDLGPASKVLFAARDLRGSQAQILFCDDDKIFSPRWAQQLFEAQQARPDQCVALIGKPIPPDRGRPGPFQPKAVRARGYGIGFRLRRLQHGFMRFLGRDRPKPMHCPVAEAGYVDILQGLGGAVVRPDFFDDTAFAIPDTVWTVDDVWLSGMLAIKGIPIWLPAGLEMPQTTEAHEIHSLYRATIEGATRGDANRRCVAYMQQHYDIWR